MDRIIINDIEHIESTKKYFANELNSLQPIRIRNILYKLLVNIDYTIISSVNSVYDILCLPQNIYDKILRDELIQKTILFLNLFKNDINTRQAVIFQNYQNRNIAACLSLFHFIIRDNALIENVYVRSQHIDNFAYDNYTYLKLANVLSNIINIQNIKINIKIASLHKVVLE